MATFLESLKRSVAAVTIDIDEAEAGKAALEARIRTLKQERQRLEAALARQLATVGRTRRASCKRHPRRRWSLRGLEGVSVGGRGVNLAAEPLVAVARRGNVAPDCDVS